jgi:CobQ-like glutamine amidotransferase family enzyme
MIKRLEWRNIDSEVIECSIGDKLVPTDYDLFFIGGGQDFEQEILLNDLLGEKTKGICDAVESGKTFLAICGGYQLLGQYYRTWDGQQLDFTGALDINTIGHTKRMIGNFRFIADLDGKNAVAAGFENHSGRTYLGDKVRPFGKIIKGYGNNGEDGTAGARYKNVFCSYSHGPLLPKNPEICDHILLTALKHKYGDYTLPSLDDSIEQKALSTILKRI